MPVDHSNNGFLKDIGTDWVALSANGAPLARAATEDGVRRAAPNAAEYITGQGDPNVKSTGEGKAHKAAPAPTIEPIADIEPAPADTVPAVEPEAEQPEPVDTVEPEQPEPVAEEPAVEPEPAPAEPAPTTSRRQRRPAESK